MAMPLEAPQASQPLQMEQVLIGPVPGAVSASTPEEEAAAVEPMDIDDPEENTDSDGSDEPDDNDRPDDFDESYDIGEPSRTGVPFGISEPFNVRELTEPGEGEYERWRFRLTEVSNCMLQQLPQFLFRVTSNNSQGTNSRGLYQAGAINNHLGYANFYSYSKDEVRESLQNHVKIKKNKQNLPSHWISFTPSIIVAMEFALRMKEQARKERIERRKEIERMKKDGEAIDDAYEKLLEDGAEDISIHIIDTTRLTNRPLIVHAYSMLKAYDVHLSAKLSWDKARVKCSYNEILVWDELKVESDYIALDDLIYPKIPKGRWNAKGLFDLMPNLGKTPKKAAWSRVQKARRFSKYYGLWAKLRLYNMACASRYLSAQDTVGPFGPKRRSNVPIPEDARVPLDEWHLLDYMTLVGLMKKDFQFPMVVALLSMRTDFINQESMVEGLIKLPEKYLKDDPRFENLCFWRTTLRPGATVDVQMFEQIYAQACEAIAGVEAVSSGPGHDHRNILRLDEDPKVATTTGAGIGTGPATMALAAKANWTGLRMSRPSKLKAELLYHRLIEEGIDQNFDLTQTQLSKATPIRLRDLEGLQDLINATCMKRQVRMEKIGWYKDKRTFRSGGIRKAGRRQTTKYYPGAKATCPVSWEAYLDYVDDEATTY